jgi:hypothetical protein
MGVNTRPIGFLRLETIDGMGFNQLLQTRGEDYGWPWAYRTVSVKTDSHTDARLEDLDEIHWRGVVGDVIVGFLIIIASAFVVEGFVHIVRHSKNR